MRNYNTVKRLYEKCPIGVKQLISPVLVNLVVKNSCFVGTLQELEYFDGLPAEEQRHIQFEKLRDILIYCYEHVPFYHREFDEAAFNPYHFAAFEEIQKLPYLTKNDAIAYNEQLLSDENRGMYESYTGGSSGKTLRVCLDKDSIYKERAFISHYLSHFGYDCRKSRTVVFLGHNKNSTYYYSPLKNEITISPFKLFNREAFPFVMKTITGFHPEFLAGYPSAIRIFASLVKENNLDLSFQHVVFYSENYREEDKKFIESIFNCQATSYYGHTERAAFAEQYGTGFRFNPLYGYTEFIPLGDNEYRIACTGFLSRKMPFVRYLTDDVATILPDGTCRILGHRLSDTVLYDKNGTEIFKGALTLHIAELKKIRQYQYEQFEKGKAVLKIIEDEKLDKAEIKIIQKYINTRCEGMLDVHIEPVSAITLTDRGKYIWAVQHIRKNGVTKTVSV